MIFEGTKNKFFFGLGLTRAGNYMQPVDVLVLLSEMYNVSINEILTGQNENSLGNSDGDSSCCG